MKETNMEHFRGEIEAYMQTHTDLPAMAGKKFKGCNYIGCEKCEWGNDEGNSCEWQFVKWLMSEYKPEPVLTAREKHFVEFVQEGWLARDEDATISLYKGVKPVKEGEHWRPFNPEIYMPDCGDFPFITWEDEEPWAVADLRKLKVKAGDQDA